MGQLVGSGRLFEQTAREQLTEAALALGMDPTSATKSISSGISDGKAKPRLPIIKSVGGQIADIIDMSEEELIASGAPIFERGSMLVQPAKRELPAADDTKTEITLLRALQPENMVYRLNRDAAVFKKWDARSKKWITVDPPASVAGGLLKKGTWRLPSVVGVVTSPTMRPDGTILDQPGYDPATQLIYSRDRHLMVPPISASPTRAEAEAALVLLKALISGFPFESALDEAVALAGLMTTILHGAYPVSPMFLMLAHTAGTGKSHLVNVASAIMTGRKCPVITNVPSMEEMEKRLGAMILEGVPIISLDNCSHDLGGDLLCQITEQEIIRIRILGKSEAPQCEWRGTLFATGNNVGFKGDMTRRGLICNMDARVEKPELRSFAFDPVARAASNRGAYVHAVLTIARAWKAANEADPCGPIGSYGQWSDAVRLPLVWLGSEDVVKSMDTSSEEDPVRTAARALVALWREHLTPDISYSTAELIRAAEEEWSHDGQPVRGELRSLLLQQAGDMRREIDGRKLGNWLRSIKGQVHGGYRIVRVASSPTHGLRYTVERVVG